MSLNLIDVIRGKYAFMTKKQRQLADYMVGNPSTMSFMTLKELAETVSMSEITILKACTMLGFGNYNELKYEFRKYNLESSQNNVQRDNLYANPLVPEYDLKNKEMLLNSICQEELETAKNFMAQLDKKELTRTVQMMLDATNTIFCARGVSVQIADFLSMRMATMGLPSVIVNTELNDSVQAALPLISKSTLVIAISLPDYYMMTTKVCEFAKQRHAKIVCITDSVNLSTISEMADITFTVPCATRLFLSTPAPVMMLANLISSALNIERSERKFSRFASPVEFSGLFKME